MLITVRNDIIRIGLLILGIEWRLKYHKWLLWFPVGQESDLIEVAGGTWLDPRPNDGATVWQTGGLELEDSNLADRADWRLRGQIISGWHWKYVEKVHQQNEGSTRTFVIEKQERPTVKAVAVWYDQAELEG